MRKIVRLLPEGNLYVAIEALHDSIRTASILKGELLL